MPSIHNLMRISVERKQIKSPSDMPQMHVHENHEIYFLLSGARRYFIKDAIYDVETDDVIIIPKGELHRTVTHKESGYDRYVIYFPDMYVDAVRAAIGNDEFERFLSSGCVHLPHAIADKCHSLCKEMLQEDAVDDKCSALLLSHKLNEIIVSIIRHGSPKQTSPEKNAERIQEVTHFITENYEKNITLHEAAQMAYLEDAYFCKQFKKFTGFGFVEYLTRVRAKAAATMLTETDLSIGEISERCGFSSSNYFGDVFKRLFGTSPRQYRKGR